MPTTLSRVFTNSQTNSPMGAQLPMINTISNSLSGFLNAQGQSQKKKALMRWVKGTPELKALTTKVTKDMVYKWHFENVNPKDSGRNKIMRANRFAVEVALRRTMFSQVFDMINTGDGFGWKGKIDEKIIKEKISKLLNNKFLETKEKKIMCERIFKELKQTEGFADSEGVDEDLLRPRKYRYVASTTVDIINDLFEILAYVQNVGGNQIKFKPDEIIHYTLEDIDGRIGGFTPVESIVVQLELLRQMWQNLMSIHKNGGTPDKMFILENSQPNSPAFRNIEQQLKKYKLVENKHGNMLFTGKVTVEDLQQMDEMQFKDSGLYITGLIAMQWGIPKSSIPYILGGTNTKDDTGGNSEKSYWRNIEYNQMLYAETMNSQLWIPHFGVKIVFDNTFIQQDVQLQTAKQLRFGNIENMDRLLRTGKKQLKTSKKLELLGLDKEDVEEMAEEDLNPMGMGGNIPNQLSDSEVNDSDDKKNIKKRKAQEQNNLLARGAGSPTGTGKEHWTYDIVEQ